MKSISVFCGSSSGSDPKFQAAARSVGQALAEAGVTLIYGGAKVGLMGTVADAALANGGKVVGVLPRFLQNKELAHPDLSEMILCDSMHERKTRMFELSQGFIALPGGFGTLEEVCEILTWQQLGLHKFPIGLLNISGFYDHLDRLFAEMEKTELLKPENRRMAIFRENVPDLLAAMKNYRAPEVAKWIRKANT